MKELLGIITGFLVINYAMAAGCTKEQVLAYQKMKMDEWVELIKDPEVKGVLEADFPTSVIRTLFTSKQHGYENAKRVLARRPEIMRKWDWHHERLYTWSDDVERFQKQLDYNDTALGDNLGVRPDMVHAWKNGRNINMVMQHGIDYFARQNGLFKLLWEGPKPLVVEGWEKPSLLLGQLGPRNEAIMIIDGRAHIVPNPYN